MGGGQSSLKNLRASHLIKIYQKRPLLAQSISLDSTFKLFVLRQFLGFLHFMKDFDDIFPILFLIEIFLIVSMKGSIRLFRFRRNG
jgi:hypothetical protein